jgi:primary-amine oxidase
MQAHRWRDCRMAERICRAAASTIIFAALACWQPAIAAPTHPLDPLDADELIAVRDILAQSDRFSTNTNFAWIQLAEPPKKIVEEFRPGTDFPRRAYVAAIDYDKGKSFRVIIDLRSNRIASIDDLGALQPGLNDTDIQVAAAVVDADPRIKEALTKRGLVIPNRVTDAVRVQYMAVGADRSLDHENNRLMRVLFASDQKSASNTSPFIDGLMAVVDLYARKVIRFHDSVGAARVQVPHDVLDPKVRGRVAATRPVLADQPEGRNFAAEGNVVTWRNWRLRYGFNLREGLVLYQIGFNDNGRVRPILFRASVSEVLTAYGDPNPLWSWMLIFDEGCWGLGYLSVAVQPGREVPANAVALGAVVPDATRREFSRLLTDRIYLYERDAGNLIHYQEESRAVHARATELVIGTLVSLGNYVFAFNWVFREDGLFAFEAELSGTVATKFVGARNCDVCAAIAQGPGGGGESRTYQSSGDDKFGGLVYPNVVGVSHQHWFNLRLDFDIDGSRNAVMENNVKRVAGAGGNERQASAMGIGVAHTVLGKSVEAKRRMSHESSRTWTIYNASALGRGRRPAGYTLMPMANTATIFTRSREREPVAFTFHHLWVTPYREGELYAAGAYPNQANRNYTDTLHSYADNSSIYDKDIVVWYSMGDTHVPRPEDFPLMSSKKISVVFHPDGFFERNPIFGPPEPVSNPPPGSQQ